MTRQAHPLRQARVQVKPPCYELCSSHTEALQQAVDRLGKAMR